ncbi:gallinacin-8-like [Manacus vitellinus]|uniref:gallinacin-8-like n=1 Tax=Manacus vitellinus TaxID=328815 RepID=UPI00115CC2CE|nr:gallinacin-8-like [Manacus vitellinus]
MSLASWSVAVLSSTGVYKDCHFGARHRFGKPPFRRKQLLYLVALNLDMKIFSLFFAVLLLMLQGTSGFMRAPDNEVQCKQAGGVCSTDHCPPPNTRSFGRCQRGVPCCRTVYD